MIADRFRFEDEDDDLDVDFRESQQPSRKRVVLSTRIETPAHQKLANQARFRRSKGAASFNGTHRRRDKRNAL